MGTDSGQILVVRMEVPSCEREGPGLEQPGRSKAMRVGTGGGGLPATCPLRWRRSCVLIRSLENSVCKHSSQSHSPVDSKAPPCVCRWDHFRCPSENYLQHESPQGWAPGLSCPLCCLPSASGSEHTLVLVPDWLHCGCTLFFPFRGMGGGHQTTPPPPPALPVT